MKTIRKRSPLLLLFLSFSLSALAQNVTTYEKDYTFDVNSDAWLNITSTFTDITISSWDKGEVFVSVLSIR